MPPKATKPKGLKASKRAAPFDPSSLSTEDSAAPANSTAGSSSVELNKDQTMPLDEDALTLYDLYELRANVDDILFPFPHSLALDPDPEKADEARSFLRGILHGCAVLEPFVRQSDYVEEIKERDEDGPRSDAEVKKRRNEAGHAKLTALGLNEVFDELFILALQSYALRNLGELFEAPEEAIKAAAVKNASGSKRRKIDVREPKTRLEWLEAAYERARLLWHGIVLNDNTLETDDSCGRAFAFLQSEYILTATVYARELAVEGQLDKAREISQDKEARWAEEDHNDFRGWGREEDEDGNGGEFALGARFVDANDTVRAQLQAWAARVALLEAYPDVAGAGEDEGGAVAELARIADGLAGQKRAYFEGEPLEDEDADLKPYWAYLVDTVVAEALAARFILLEDQVEAKYRPEESGAENGEGEEEVKPLPMDAEEVIAAKKASEEALAAVRAVIAAHAELSKKYQHPEGKLVQYRKLEELLLVSSALINPDDFEGTAKIEKEIEEARKEGGLEDEEGEGEEDGAAAEEEQ
ncbi:hypothetical protein JCM8097_002391 [Rhodosporidiobolus ruineniae]